MTPLTLEIIKKYNLPKETFKPDWDDAGYRFTLPNGIELECLFMCNSEPCEVDMLEGLDGFICIDTEEELIHLIETEFEVILQEIKEKDSDFDEYI